MGTEAARRNRPNFKVTYPDLGGGRNTRKDSHALARNQLAIALNTWMFAGHSVSKRPGSLAAITSNGATGSGVGINGMAATRFTGVSSILAQSGSAVYAARPTDTSWTNIGSVTANAGPIQVAQMYDPTLTASAAFLTNGVDFPKTWKGPGFSLATVGTAPLNHSGSATITPKYCATLMNSLWYSGEGTEPTAVYISDPTLPESFTFGGQLPGASYVPYLVGYNDGIAGGDITAIVPLGSAMIVYKQSAVYAFQYTGYYGDVGPWAVTLLSSSIGCTSPRSVVSFDTFHAFLGIDGTYTVDLQNGVSKRPISDNNPDLFDGPLAAILDRTSAVGVRYGSKYMLWYDNGGVPGVPPRPNTFSPLGYPSAGVWFDFLFPDEDGLPCVGELRGMNVNGVAPLRGPADTGNFVWGNGAADQVGIFGSLTGDFGSAITTIFAGKSDFFEAELQGSSLDSIKQANEVALAISFVNPQQGEQLSFLFSLTSDLYSSLQSFVESSSTPDMQGAAVVGSAVVGTAVLGMGNAAQQFQIVRGYAQNGVRGHVLQVAFQESSVFPWTTLGYVLTVSSQEAIKP